MSTCLSQAPLPSRPGLMSAAMAADIASAPLGAGRAPALAVLGLAIFRSLVRFNLALRDGWVKIGSHFGSDIARLRTESHGAMKLGLYDIGCTAVYATRSDPRFSYCLYVPPDYRAGRVRPELLVVVHGSPRTFMEFRDRFQDFGAAHNTLILCPLFPVGVSGHGNPDGYKYF